MSDTLDFEVEACIYGLNDAPRACYNKIRSEVVIR